ncbi:RecX family transcriptional regulator [bacterium]|nr:RecX family transcriptional regulator [bacterium]
MEIEIRLTMKIIFITSFVKKYQKKIVGVVELDNGEKLQLEPDTIMQFQLQTGTEIDEKTLHNIRLADQKRKSLQKALQLISIRPRSAGELRERFKREGYLEETIESSLSHLIDNGYLNDELFAERFAKSKLQKKDIGEAALRYELHKKGLSKQIIENVLTRIYLETPPLDMAITAARKKLRTIRVTDPVKRRRKLYQFLSQRGFSADIIHRVIAELLN